MDQEGTMKVLLGILIGVAVVRIIRHLRWRHAHGHPFFFGGRCGRGRRHIHRLMWALRELDLDPRQKDELQEVWHRLRRTVGDVQVGRWRTMSDVVEAATGEPLDRAKLDELAARHTETQAKAAREVVDTIARVHEVLRPEQRARLRELVERAGLWRFPRHAAPPPAEGPYR
jgi:Spy/CpxP family protein refolding chaperone